MTHNKDWSNVLQIIANLPLDEAAALHSQIGRLVELRRTAESYNQRFENMKRAGDNIVKFPNLGFGV